MSDTKNRDDAVGYGKPPKSGQFRKGQSGNPKGRPKGSLDYKTYVKQMLATRVTINEGGCRKRVSSLQATLMRLAEKSLNGDMKAIEKVLSLAGEMAIELEARRESRALSQNDEQILKRYRASVDAVELVSAANGHQHD